MKYLLIYESGFTNARLTLEKENSFIILIFLDKYIFILLIKIQLWRGRSGPVLTLIMYAFVLSTPALRINTFCKLHKWYLKSVCCLINHFIKLTTFFNKRRVHCGRTLTRFPSALFRSFLLQAGAVLTIKEIRSATQTAAKLVLTINRMQFAADYEQCITFERS